MDGRAAANPLAWIDLDRQRITLGGAEAPSLAKRAFALHKPRGIITTRQDERGRRTVYDLLPPGLPWLFPAGRLDADSEGLLILTNDSQLALRLTDPRYHVPKVYQITLRGSPSAADLEQVRKGIVLSDGLTRPAPVRVLAERPGATVVEMVLTEGRNRQARRMWAAVGHRVRRLLRVAVGGYRLGDLPAGALRPLAAADLRRLTERESPRSGKKGG